MMEVIFQEIGTRVVVDTHEYSLEQICANSNVSIIAAESSIGLYAAMMGRKVYSYAPILQHISPDFDKYMVSLYEDIGFELGTNDLSEICSLNSA
jgi:hypothetical protein